MKNATTDESSIRAWCKTWSDSNWAITPGDDGLVLDVDPRHGGWESLKKWTQENGDLPETLSVSTGGGGAHYYFRTQNQVGSPQGWLPGVDIKGAGGYVILPPSGHISGARYAWARVAEVASAPVALVEAIAVHAQHDNASLSLNSADVLAGLPEGQRDAGLFKWSCYLRRKFSNEPDQGRRLVEVLVLAAAAACSPPFPADDALAKVRQAYKMDHDSLTAAEREWAALVSGDVNVEPGLRLRKAEEVRNQEPVPQLIEGVLPEGALFQVFGQTGSYKSFVMLDMLLSVANGIPWMDHEVKATGLVAFVLGEGGGDAGQRLDAWLDGHPEARDDLLLYSVEEQLDLMNPEHVQAVIRDLDEYQKEHHPDQQWRLIVFDTQADHMPSGDEDRAKDFTVIKRAIQAIRLRTGAAVGLVHHTGWDESRERGSSRQRQALDVVMQVEHQTIKNIKQKMGALFDPIPFAVTSGGQSVFVETSTLAQMLKQGYSAYAKLTGEEVRDVVTAVVDSLPGRPSMNQLRKDLKRGHAKVEAALLEAWGRGFIDLQRDDDGKLKSFEATNLGIEWVQSGCPPDVDD